MVRNRGLVLVLVLSLVAASGCASFRKGGSSQAESTGSKSDSKEDAAKSAKAKEKSAKKKAEEKVDKLRKKEQQLHYAELEREIEALNAAVAERASEESIEKAERELKNTQEALQHFQDVESPMKLSRSNLGLERATWNMEAQRQELHELEVMYQKEEIATLTKELVLQRGQKRLQFAKSDLEMRQKDNATLTDHELPKTLRERTVAVSNAMSDLRKAKSKQEEQVLSRKLKELKAKHGMEELRREISKLRNEDPQDDEEDEK